MQASLHKEKYILFLLLPHPSKLLAQEEFLPGLSRPVSVLSGLYTTTTMFKSFNFLFKELKTAVLIFTNNL